MTDVQKIKVAIKMDIRGLLSKKTLMRIDIEITLKNNPNINPSVVFLGLMDVKLFLPKFLPKK